MLKFFRKDEGFTLVELLIVIAIIGVLAAIAIPVFLSQVDKAEAASVKSDANTIAKYVAAVVAEDDTIAGITLGTGELTFGTAGEFGSINTANTASFSVSNSATDWCVSVTDGGSPAQTATAGPGC